MFSESLGAIDCDCSSQLREAIRRVKEEGGVVVYLFEEGRGIGLREKFRAVRLQQETGLNTGEVYEQLGQDRDPRDYSFVSTVLNEILGARGAVLMTNNPTRRAALIEQGVNVVRTEPLIIRTPSTKEYLLDKAEALGHEV